MPEIAEVARTVHFIRKHLVGKTLAKVTALDDANVYGKVGTSGAEFQKSLTGKQVIDAGQQGKYFWMIMSSPPHPVMHFGMAGWLKYKDEHTYYYKPKAGEEKEEWPPKYWKFMLETKEEPKVEAAFVDLRRFSRVRLVDCKAEDIRKVSPLAENGPDPVIDKDIVTEQWLAQKCRAKKVPIKAMLLDQANISGIGNWVGDEIMYDAKMHPEQYANTLSDEQIKQLHKSIHHICGTAVELLADSEKFPEEWLFKHRWGKGKKDASKTLPNGEAIKFLTVGGRTSAVIPSVQKKTGPVAKEMSDVESGGEKEAKPKKSAPKKKNASIKDDEDDEPPTKTEKPISKKRKSVSKEDDEDEAPTVNGTKAKKVASGKRKSGTLADDEEKPAALNDDEPKTNGTAKPRKSKFKEELEDDELTAEPMTTIANQGKKRKASGKEDAIATPKKRAIENEAAASEGKPEEKSGRRKSGRSSKS